MAPMTEHERSFATAHHDIVIRYLRWRRLDPNEYYDIVILRYMGAVQRYLNLPELQRYAFETIACGAMRSALYNHFRSERRRLSFCVTNTDLVERTASCRLAVR